MAEAESLAAAWGCTRAGLHCNPSNQPAMQLYRRLRYKNGPLEAPWMPYLQVRLQLYVAMDIADPAIWQPGLVGTGICSSGTHLLYVAGNFSKQSATQQAESGLKLHCRGTVELTILSCAVLLLQGRAPDRCYLMMKRIRQQQQQQSGQTDTAAAGSPAAPAAQQC
jgi:hypothetical protein